MANELLDFVMSLVRDPNAAAAYADNPAQAIADAHLTDVTSVDVNNLIPVVSESLSMAVPNTGSEHLADDPSSNVWASGAATAAFDAFDTHVPLDTLDQVHTVAANLVQEPQEPQVPQVPQEPPVPDAGPQPGLDAVTGADVPTVAGLDDPSLHFDGPVVDDVPHVDAALDDGFSHHVVDDHHLEPDPSGFDIFE
jgi:hypothetical protein